MRSIIENRKTASAGKGTPKHDACQRREGSALDAEIQTEYTFLKEEFHPIASVSLPVCEEPFGQAFANGKIEWRYKDEIKIDAIENILYLEKTVEAYCNAQCAKFDYLKSNNPLENLCNLLNLAQSASPEGFEVILDYDERRNMVVMKEFTQCECDYYTLFFLPVSFVEKLPEKIKPMVKQALGVISAINGMEMPEEHFDMAYALGVWDGGESFKEMEEEDPTRYLEFMELVNDYLSGEIHDLIAECSICIERSDTIIEKIIKAIPEYSGTNIATLLNLLIKGLELAHEGSWKQYSLTPDYCDIEDYDNRDEVIMDQSRLFALVYDLMDEIVESATECINAEAGSMCMEGFYDYRELTPETKDVFTPSDFLKRWSEWFSEFIDTIQTI